MQRELNYRWVGSKVSTFMMLFFIPVLIQREFPIWEEGDESEILPRPNPILPILPVPDPEVCSV